jgi:hypothetical protein
MRAIGKAFGQIVLWILAAVGLGTLVLAYLPWLFSGTHFDNGVVLDVIIAPRGGEAAVVYFHNHQDSSGKFIAVKLVRTPFPEIGNKIDPYDDVFRIEGDESRWADEPIRLQWWKKSALLPESLDVCAPGSHLIPL